MATTITPQIVNISVSVVTAAQPSQLQQSGAIVSCGGTTLTSGTYQYASQLSGVTSILAAPIAISTITWSSSTVTATTATALDLTVGDTFTTTIAGVTPAGYNGTFTATVASTTSFTYALTTNPGTETVLGTYTPPYSAFLTNAATTFFAQGSSVGVYVLELGAQTSVSTGISALTTWITNNLNVFYAYLVPKSGMALR